MPKHLRNGVGQLFVLASLERRQSLAGYRVFFVKVTQIPYKTLEHVFAVPCSKYVLKILSRLE